MLKKLVRTRTMTIVEVFEVAPIGKNDTERLSFCKAKLQCGDPEETRTKDGVSLISYNEAGHSQVVEIQEGEWDYGEA